MKTAIFNTDFWEDDKIFSLNTDTRQLYLCLITNPKRNVTPSFKCSERLLTAYTGYTKETIELCKRQLQEKELVFFIRDYVILGKSCYVQPTKGKLSRVLFDKNMAELPNDIRDFVQELHLSGSCEPQEYNNKDKDNNKDNTNDSDITTTDAEQIRDVIEAFAKFNPACKKMYGNTTQREACSFLIETYSFALVMKVINLLPQTNERDFLPVITTPLQLRDKWVSLESGLKKIKHAENKTLSTVVFSPHFNKNHD